MNYICLLSIFLCFSSVSLVSGFSFKESVHIRQKRDEEREHTNNRQYETRSQGNDEHLQRTESEHGGLETREGGNQEHQRIETENGGHEIRTESTNDRLSTVQDCTTGNMDVCLIIDGTGLDVDHFDVSYIDKQKSLMRDMINSIRRQINRDAVHVGLMLLYKGFLVEYQMKNFEGHQFDFYVRRKSPEYFWQIQLSPETVDAAKEKCFQASSGARFTAQRFAINVVLEGEGTKLDALESIENSSDSGSTWKYNYMQDVDAEFTQQMAQIITDLCPFDNIDLPDDQDDNQDADSHPQEEGNNRPNEPDTDISTGTEYTKPDNVRCEKKDICLIIDSRDVNDGSSFSNNTPQKNVLINLIDSLKSNVDSSQVHIGILSVFKNYVMEYKLRFFTPHSNTRGYLRTKSMEYLGIQLSDPNAIITAQSKCLRFSREGVERLAMLVTLYENQGGNRLDILSTETSEIRLEGPLNDMSVEQLKEMVFTKACVETDFDFGEIR